MRFLSRIRKVDKAFDLNQIVKLAIIIVVKTTIGVIMKISTAVAMRISKILQQRNMSQYALEKKIAMPHNTMKTLMGEKNNSVNLKTLMQIIQGLDMTAAEFFDDPVFENSELEIY